MTKSPTGKLPTEPNLQSLTYPKEEHICIDLDYSSIELRLAAQIVGVKIPKTSLSYKELSDAEVMERILNNIIEKLTKPKG